MDRLRLAVALPHLGVYGGVRRFLELGRVWTERGHDVTIATPGGVGHEDRRAVDRRATDRLGDPLDAFPSEERRSAGRREEDRTEVTWLPFPGRLATIDEVARERWDAVLSPDPALFRNLHPDGALRVFYAVLEKAPGAEEAWRSADLVLANSSGIGRHLERRGVRATLAVGGVNLSVFHPPDPDPRPARAREGRPLRALVYGRLSRKRKGTLAAARAVSMAAVRTRTRVELTLFDAPPPVAPAPPERLPLQISHRWVLHPSQAELAALYGDADLFVSAERRAGWSNTAAEAMACGAAVVCTKSGTEDFARHGETALVSRFPWAWSLAGQVARLLRDAPLRAAIAERGRERIRWFPWERTADAIEGALRERLGRERLGKPA
jgi:glycosyltransferase involved in cell wall biosynthesis